MSGTTQDVRNEEVMAVLDQAARMLRSMAVEWHTEYDELYQMAALAALEQYEKAQQTDNPQAYLYGVIRHLPWQLFSSVTTMSLDEPLSAESETTYADLLATPTPVPVDEKREDKRTRALYASLRRLPLEAQEYLCRVHHLNAYQPVSPRRGRYAGKMRARIPDTEGALSQLAYQWLRQNGVLAKVICPQSLEIPLIELGDE